MKETTKKRLQQMLAQEVAEGNTAGVSLLFRKNGEDVFFDAQGWADLERRIPLGREHIFRLYSMTKPVTAVAAMMLVERGELDLNMPVAEVLPGFCHLTVWDGNGEVPAQREMTVLHLMNMTAGIGYGDEDVPGNRKLREYLAQCGEKLHGENAVMTMEFANAIGQFPLAFEPDSGWCYGFCADVLGAVIEAVSGMSFGEFLERNLFRPLKMKDTGFWIPAEKYNRYARTYEAMEDGGLVPYEGEYLLISNRVDRPPRFESGGAGLVSTIDDYARFAQMLLNGGTLEGERILFPQTVKYLLSGELTGEQMQGLRQFGGHEGYTYSHLMRRLVDPGQACLMSQEGEYGWAGWLRCYFANIPSANATVLLMQQRKGPVAVSLARRVRNVLSSEL